MTAKKNFPLRIDPRLFEIIEGWAADEFRSVNAHIEYLLRESVRNPRKQHCKKTKQNRKTSFLILQSLPAIYIYMII